MLLNLPLSDCICYYSRELAAKCYPELSPSSDVQRKTKTSCLSKIKYWQKPQG